MCGTGAPGGHGAKGGAHHARDVVGPGDHCVPFGQRAHQGVLIDLGEGEFSVRADGDIGGDAKHRVAAFVRLNQPRKDLGGTATRGAFGHTDPTGDAAIAVGHIGGVAFISGQDVADIVVQPVHRIIERQRGVTAKPEDMLNAMGLQHPHHCFRAV